MKTSVGVFNMNSVTDNRIKLLQEGDIEAYSSIFREFYAPLLSFSIKYTKDKESSEDIVQEFFCKLWDDRRNIKDNSSLKSYIYTAIKNRSLNYLRNNHNIPIGEYDTVSEEEFLLEIMEEEIYKELYSAIEKLPNKCKEVFLLKVEGKNNQEIATILNISEETVRSQLRHGKKILSPMLTNLFSLFVIYSLK